MFGKNKKFKKLMKDIKKGSFYSFQSIQDEVKDMYKNNELTFIQYADALDLIQDISDRDLKISYGLDRKYHPDYSKKKKMGQ